MSNIIYFIIRGGSWFDLGMFAASGDCDVGGPDDRRNRIGFRITRKRHAQP